MFSAKKKCTTISLKKTVILHKYIKYWLSNQKYNISGCNSDIDILTIEVNSHLCIKT